MQKRLIGVFIVILGLGTGAGEASAACSRITIKQSSLEQVQMQRDNTPCNEANVGKNKILSFSRSEATERCSGVSCPDGNSIEAKVSHMDYNVSVSVCLAERGRNGRIKYSWSKPCQISASTGVQCQCGPKQCDPNPNCPNSSARQFSDVLEIVSVRGPFGEQPTVSCPRLRNPDGTTRPVNPFLPEDPNVPADVINPIKIALSLQSYQLGEEATFINESSNTGSNCGDLSVPDAVLVDDLKSRVSEEGSLVSSY